MGKRNGRALSPDSAVYIRSAASVVGKKEGEGPLADKFDAVETDSYLGQKTWEKAESELVRRAVTTALTKASLAPDELDAIFAGDLLNQCTASCFGLTGFGRPLVGLFGACSTAVEGLALAAMSIDGGFASTVAVATSSHFCTAERQFRLPLAYGGQRPPTAQWTVTGSGAFVLSSSPGGEGRMVTITGMAIGAPVDLGVSDVNNMGAAMAPAAVDTIKGYFDDTGTGACDYDLIATGDLGAVGASIVAEQLKLGDNYRDCGMMIFDAERQDMHAGASGCACSAVVAAADILPRMLSGELSNVLLVGTGALMSTTSFQQGENVVGVAHLVRLSAG